MSAALAFMAAFFVSAAVLYFALARLIRSRTVTATELATVAAERDRLAAELAAERTSHLETIGKVTALTGELGSASAGRDALEAQLSIVRAELAELSGRANAESEQLASVRTKLEVRDDQVRQQASNITAVQQENKNLLAETARLQSKNAELGAELTHTRIAQEELKTFLSEAQEKLSAVFAKLAGTVFDEKAQVFEKKVEAVTDRSKENIDALLRPFAEQIYRFRQRVDHVYGEEAKERSALVGAVTELKTLNQDMALQAAALTKALRGSSKVRGDWGELMLETVLNGSGLEEGVHYTKQQSAVAEEGNRLQADVVVKFPDDRHIVIDSKVNLVAWQDAMNAEDPLVHQEALKRHATALRQHVRDLGAKNYPTAIGASALPCTVAFVPIEGALSAALGVDPSLQTEAFERGVVLASPNTLMALLRVVERLWTRDRIQKQAHEISEAGNKLLNAVVRFLEEFDSVGKKLSEANRCFTDARNALSESPQALIPRARRLVELGVKGKKSKALPGELTSGEVPLIEIESMPAETVVD